MATSGNGPRRSGAPLRGQSGSGRHITRSSVVGRIKLFNDTMIGQVPFEENNEIEVRVRRFVSTTHHSSATASTTIKRAVY
jgi:hypothetical protein